MVSLQFYFEMLVFYAGSKYLSECAFMVYYNISAYSVYKWDISEISPFGPRYQAGLEKGSP